MQTIFEFKSVQEFVKAVGKDVEAYFGGDKGTIVYLQPDGSFYGTALQIWLAKDRKKDVLLTTMEDDGTGLEDERVEGRKVLIVDNDIVTGKGYKRSVEALRLRQKDLKIKDIKFATFFDRIGVADFSVQQYSSEAIWQIADLDAIDLKIISLLAKDGRMALSDIGKEVKLSAVAVRKRLAKLLKEKVVSIRAQLTPDRFYGISAQILIEAEEKSAENLIASLGRMQEVYHIVQVTGTYNLVIGVLGLNLESVEDFVEKRVRMIDGVKRIEVYIGEAPVVPRGIHPKM